MAKVHHMTQKYGGLSGSFSAQLQQFADETMERASEIFQRVAIEVGSTVIRLSPVDTGKFKANWQFSTSTPDSAIIEDFDKAGNETLAKLIREAGQLTYGQTAYIFNNLPYANPLEYGHSGQAPQGMVRITLARFKEIVNGAIQEGQQ